MVPVQLSVTVGSTNGGCWLHTVAVIATCPATTGFTRSVVQVAVCTNGSLSFPQTGRETHRYGCVDVQPVALTVLVCGYPVLRVMVPVQLSVTVGSTNGGCWLHTVPVTAACPATTGFTRSVVQVAVCTNGSLSFPQASRSEERRVEEDLQSVALTV